MRTLIATTVSCLTLSLPAFAQGIANPGFEDPITFDGPPFVGFWEGFNAGAGSSAANSATLFHGGAQSLELSINGVDNSFAGAFQDVPVTGGLAYTFSGWHITTSSPLDLGIELRIEWRNSGSNTEISRTPNLTTAPGATWSLFNLTAPAPAGADIARVVYAIQTFGPEPSNTGTVYVDDVALVPEPSSIALLALGGFTLLACRRRQV